MFNGTIQLLIGAQPAEKQEESEMANKSDLTRDAWMLKGPLAKRGYDWWWHSLTAENVVTGESKAFYIEFAAVCCDLAEYGFYLVKLFQLSGKRRKHRWRWQ